MTKDHSDEQHALECQDRIETMTDAEILDAYEATDGEPGSQWVDLVAAAIEARGIDV